MTSAWMFWASWSRTPQLIAGGRRPSPRKLSDVSLMMIAGIASVVAAMMWLMNDGTMWRKMIRDLLQPSELGGHDEIFLLERDEPPPDDPGELGPADERDDDRDGEVDLHDVPVAGKGGGQAHPEGNRRNRAQDLDDRAG